MASIPGFMLLDAASAASVLTAQWLAWLSQAPFVYADWWMAMARESPWHVGIETSLIVFIVYVVLFKRQYDPRQRGFGDRGPDELTEAEIDELVAEWEPEPLVPHHDNPDAYWNQRVVIDHTVGHKHVALAGREDQPVLNLATNDFLGAANSKEARDVAKKALDEYSCGSCGPRGFYGTTKAHMDLEESIAEFMGTKESIAYSDAVSVVASAVPAFAKRGDVLVCDSGINHALQTGCTLSRSKLLYFEHNDADDLERVLKNFVKTHKALADGQRRFIVIEGLYKNSGHLANLPPIVAAARRYKFRIIADESLSWGVLGENGRGISEHYNMPVSSIDVIVASLATSLGSVGGFCVGSREVTDHQRLSGAGYCFSASAPPFTCAIASAALASMTPNKLSKLRKHAQRLASRVATIAGLEVVSDSSSPVLHARLAGAGDGEAGSRQQQEAFLQRVVEEALARGVLLSRDRSVPGDKTAEAPALRICVTSVLSNEDVDAAASVVAAAVRAAEEAAARGELAQPATAGAGAGAGVGIAASVPAVATGHQLRSRNTPARAAAASRR